MMAPHQKEREAGRLLIEALAELEALQADKARLDWLEQGKYRLAYNMLEKHWEIIPCNIMQADKVRDTIDAAMRQSGGKT